jgi:uncharacterized protein (TIGR03083 family)
MTISEPPVADLVAELRHSHDRFAAALTPLSDEQVTARSYDTEWTIAQVASHLGSGAEIFGLFIDAGQQQKPAPGAEAFRPVWDRWNSKTPAEHSRDGLKSDAALLEQIEALTPHADWHLDLFGTERTLASLVRMRLAEHALHTWDIAVALDGSETVSEDAVGLVIDNLSELVGRVGKGADKPTTVQVTTIRPDRNYSLELTTDGARLGPAETGASDATATLRLPGEAFTRMLYGRLDPDHTPASVEVDGIELDTLRRAFPGV